MTDRPILFSAPMIRAILEGRKTQTRRIINPQPIVDENGAWQWNSRNGGFVGASGSDVECGFAGTAKHWNRIQPGDRLWVREAWRCEARLDKLAPREIATNYPGIKYVATADPDSFGIEGKYRQAMHMPRWASRITLIVTDVRVQRLLDISEEDAIAEGIEKHGDGWRDYWISPDKPFDDPRESFDTLWFIINGHDICADNPWVSAYTFTPIFQNIDQIAEAA